jgi:FkbM family methyltransferase
MTLIAERDGLTLRRVLRSFRDLPFLPCSLAERGFSGLAYQPGMILWGKAIGAALGAATAKCLLRRHQDVFMPAATFASILLRPGDVFVDIGAHDGLISLLAAQAVGNSGCVYSFEPNPAAFARLQCICRAYGLDQVHCENCAVGTAEGTAVLYVPADATGATLSEQASLAAGATHQPCRVRTLDIFWQEHSIVGSPTLLKIDVEGAELDVLTGAKTLLACGAPPMVIFEASDANASTFGRTVDQVLEFLVPFGYRFWTLRHPNLIPVTKSAEINPSQNPGFWTDVLALHPKVHGSRFEHLRRRFSMAESPMPINNIDVPEGLVSNSPKVSATTNGND